MEVTGQVQGHVTTDVTWENDNDPVDENVAATVNAVSPDGDRTVGPWKLQRDPAKAGRYTTAETLPAGQWKVTVEVGFPALGRGEKELTVDPAAEPAPLSSPTAAGPPVPERKTSPEKPATRPQAEPGHEGGGWWIAAAGAALALLAGAGAFWWRRRTR
ncbi:LPXTG cell wall anchor domain-containing protein [Streptomyces cinnamoneus]|uniref:LPXTG cell wall anchor domain-containing protein n=1 Tax=Streptomyces cinnamoneus TaxID=53446 RepID=UPI001865A32E|nr:LPXTG cell wall anchor domain-containing protein [Streptomyces cinnamoneus]